MKNKTTVSKLKRKLWPIFSRFTRLRDCLETTGTIEYGICITCGAKIPFKFLDAGHFVGGRGNAVLFDEEQVNAQCKRCNMNGGNWIPYEKIMLKRHGKEKVEAMKRMYWQPRSFTTYELKDMIIKYKQKVKELENR